jgi:hypothetical protein
MAEKKEILASIDFLGDRISNQVRTVALSVIATVWLFAIGGKDVPVLPTSPDKNLLLISGGLCLVALFVDYLQYLAGYVNTYRVLRSGEKNQLADFKYNRTAFLYRVRTWCFWLKQTLVVTAFLLLAFAIGASLFAMSANPSAASSAVSAPAKPPSSGVQEPAKAQKSKP